LDPDRDQPYRILTQGPASVPPGQRARNLALATVAGQVGCSTVVLIFFALFAGLWLDAQFGVKGPFTIILLLLSIPVSLFLVLRMALGAVRAIQPPAAETENGSGAVHVKED